jgi:predicted nuclease with TOPRIM domain
MPNDTRAEHEQRIRQVVETQLAVHDQLAAAQDDNARLHDALDRMRVNRDIQQARADQYQQDNAMLQAKLDHALEQVGAMRTRLDTTAKWFRSQADVIEEMTEEALRRPYENMRIASGDNGAEIPAFMKQGPNTEH